MHSICFGGYWKALRHMQIYKVVYYVAFRLHMINTLRPNQYVSSSEGELMKRRVLGFCKQFVPGKLRAGPVEFWFSQAERFYYAPITIIAGRIYGGSVSTACAEGILSKRR